ncbi:hypothetical protein AB3S75_000283 [Citrus x aurantiifolia]
MALKNLFLIILFLITSLVANASAMNKPASYGLGARLQASGGQFNECLKAYQELNKCSAVIYQFFFTGMANVAPCCGAIETVTRKCAWPSTLPWFGYTPQQSNILLSYCRAISPAPSPAQA